MSCRAMSVPGVYLCALLAGCGDSPPSAGANAEIEQCVRDTRPDLIDGHGNAVEVTSIKVAGWKKLELGSGAPPGYTSDWTAVLRIKEPHAFIVTVVDGATVVHTVLRAGDELAFKGTITGGKEMDGQWGFGAFVTSDDAWQPVLDKAGPITMGYPVFQNGNRDTRFRTVIFQPLSKLKPCVEEGSKEEQAMIQAANEKLRAAQAAAEERRRREQEAAAERQRQAQAAAEERARQAREAEAERQRQAREEAARLAEAQRRARLLPLLAPFKSASGVVITNDAGATMGTLLTECTPDEESLTVKGRGVALRTMPFREFTFDGAFDARGALTLTTTLGPDPLVFTSVTPKGLAGAGGITLAPINEEERARLDAIDGLGRRLGSATPAELKVEVLEAAPARTRLAELQTAPLTGTVLYRERNSPAVLALFSGDPRTRNHQWRAETVALRLAEPAAGKGLLIKGSGAATDNLLIVVNGVHTLKIDAIPRLGAAIVTFPSEIEVIDLRLEARGAAYSTGIVLVK